MSIENLAFLMSSFEDAIDGRTKMIIAAILELNEKIEKLSEQAKK